MRFFFHFVGENKIYLELMTSMNTNGNPPPDVQDNREIQRRVAVSKTKVFTRISFNGKEVCQSSEFFLKWWKHYVRFSQFY